MEMCTPLLVQLTLEVSCGSRVVPPCSALVCIVIGWAPFSLPDPWWCASSPPPRLCAEYDDDGNLIVPGKPSSGKMPPLPPVDHSTIEYPPVRKQFYVEHADTRAWTVQQVAEFRQQETIVASGHDVLKPIQSFMHAGTAHCLATVSLR
jgi:hypothetical protein